MKKSTKVVKPVTKELTGQEGLLKRLPLNPLATLLAGPPVHGPVVILTYAEMKADMG
jgi:hypothetical protein